MNCRCDESKDEELIAALEQWLGEALEVIEAKLVDLAQLIGMPRWYPSPGGGFKYYPYTAMYRFGAFDEAIFTDSKAWPNVVTLVGKHERLAQHCNTLVGSANGSARAYSLQELCKFLLPKLEIAGVGKFFADTNVDVKKRVSAFMQALNADHIEHMTVWPIHGLATEATIKLDQFTEFRKLSIEEKLHCLNFEIIKPRFAEEMTPERCQWFGLCRRTLDGKSFGSENNNLMPDIARRYAEIEQVLEDFLVIVPLANSRIAYHAGGFHAAPHFETGGILAFGAVGRGVGSSSDFCFLFVDEGAELTDEGIRKICELWTFIRNSSTGKFKKRVGNAARRLFYAETRAKPEDALVDLMIAAESLYLNSDKNELRYRVSLNAALWSECEAAGKTEILKDFKAAYDLRSRVVHGSEASAQSVMETVAVIKPILRDGIRKALEHLNQTPHAPNWETMIFGLGSGEDAK